MAFSMREKDEAANPPVSVPLTVNGGLHVPTPPKGIIFSDAISTSNSHRRSELFKKLSILDRLLSPAILFVMVIGVVIGEFVPNVQKAFDTARFDSVSIRKQHI
jgi:hypothetical protein